MRRLPPRRRCPRCRREFRGWSIRDCPTCKMEGAVMAAGVAEAVRQERLDRRDETLGGGTVGLGAEPERGTLVPSALDVLAAGEPVGGSPADQPATDEIPY